jgi:biopolymer transport protein TolR
MGIAVGGANRGAVSEMNVVPLIDILLVLLVIFMILPHTQTGLDVALPQQSVGPVVPQPEAVVVVQVLADGSLRINREQVEWNGLQARLEDVFKFRASHTAFIRGDTLVEFGVVAKAIDVMRTAGISSVGLLTPGLEKPH